MLRIAVRSRRLPPIGDGSSVPAVLGIWAAIIAAALAWYGILDDGFLLNRWGAFCHAGRRREGRQFTYGRLFTNGHPRLSIDSRYREDAKEDGERVLHKTSPNVRAHIFLYRIMCIIGINELFAKSGHTFSILGVAVPVTGPQPFHIEAFTQLNWRF